MAFTAAASFGIADINQGRFSPIHLLSAFTLLQVPVIAWSARAHKVARYRAAVRAMVAGALIIAGFFTFPLGACWVDGCSDESRRLSSPRVSYAPLSDVWRIRWDSGKRTLAAG